MNSMNPDWLGTDAMWDMVCRYEDGETVERAEVAALSDHDRAIYTKEARRIDSKRRAAEIAELERSHREVCGPANHNVYTGFCYEGAIMARDARDSSWWT